MPLTPEQEERHRERVGDALRKEGREPTEEEVEQLANDLAALAEIFVENFPPVRK